MSASACGLAKTTVSPESAASQEALKQRSVKSKCTREEIGLQRARNSAHAMNITFVQCGSRQKVPRQRGFLKVAARAPR